MHGYAYCADLNDKLGLSTLGKGKGLYETSSVYNGDNWSLGFRINAATNQPSGTILHNTEAVHDTATNWRLWLDHGELYYSDDTNGDINIYVFNAAGLHHFWIDVEETLIDIYVAIDGDGGAGTFYDQLARVQHTPTDSRVDIMDTRAIDDALDSPVFDFAFVTGGAADNGIYRYGGCDTFGWTRFYPLREGSGVLLTDVITGGALTVTGGGPSWTAATDAGKRWA